MQISNRNIFVVVSCITIMVRKGEVPWNKGKTGFKCSEETKIKIGNANRGKVRTEEQRKKISDAQTGKHRSEEARRRMSESSLKGEMNPSWKGDDVSYRSLHEWVQNHIPKPDACPKCGKVCRLHISNVDHKYSRDLNDYQYLCPSCHGKYHTLLRKLQAFKETLGVNKDSGEQQTT